MANQLEQKHFVLSKPEDAPNNYKGRMKIRKKYPSYLLNFEIVKGLTDDQIEQQRIEYDDPQDALSNTGN